MMMININLFNEVEQNRINYVLIIMHKKWLVLSNSDD